MNQNLAVGFGVELVALLDKGRAKLLVVVDFAVEGENKGLVLVVNRLMTGVKVDNRQSAEAHVDRLVDIEALGIGSAVSDHRSHLFQHVLAVFKLACEAANSTHI